MVWSAPLVTSVPAAAQASPAGIDTLYGINWNTSSSGLYTVDRTTAAWTLVGATSLTQGAGLAWDAANAQMWACTQNGFSARLDRSTGTATSTTAVGLACGGMTYDSTNDVLLGCAWNTHGTYTVDRTTGAWNLLGGTGLTSVQERGMAYDPVSDTIFGCDSQDSMYTVDGTTGAWTLLGTAGGGTESGLAVDTSTGTLYGCDFNGGLYTVDTTTGAWTLVGTDSSIPTFALGLTYVP